MERLTIPGVAKPITRIVIGTLVFSPHKEVTGEELLDDFFAAGGNAIDTAHAYGGGDSERVIGAWLKTRDNREEVFLIDKGAHHTPKVPRPRLNPQEIKCDLDESLDRLHTDYIDLYLLHRDDPQIPVATIVDYLNQEIESGRILAFGASNWTHQRIQEANEYAAQNGLIGFAVSSSNLSLAVPMEAMWPGVLSASEEAQRWHRDNDFPLLSWSSQARGFFSGQFTPENRDDENMVRVYYNSDNFERLRRAHELGSSIGYSAIQISLAYVIHQPYPTLPIVGPCTRVELDSSLEALEIELSDDQIRWLNLED
ncbi:MAG: aldo/keto reductase [Candidatus Poribacteria bacterium]|nr:aldo/keto reductase [Candidatus Poribacteria bacterium]MDE0506307.1 aldo/keto reductase [Candidatus Poribacteria bacterium]